jgi:hypothetical protein
VKNFSPLLQGILLQQITFITISLSKRESKSKLSLLLQHEFSRFFNRELKGIQNLMNIGLKIKNYILFTKFRLSALVIISALSGYLFAGGTDGGEIALLMFGGILVTAASNGSNQIWERKLDI